MNIPGPGGEEKGDGSMPPCGLPFLFLPRGNKYLLPLPPPRAIYADSSRAAEWRGEEWKGRGRVKAGGVGASDERACN